MTQQQNTTITTATQHPTPMAIQITSIISAPTWAQAQP